jgi:hypothetical protein
MVKWEETYFKNRAYGRPFEGEIQESTDGYHVIPVRRADLDFDRIKAEVNWPPKLPNSARGGLTAYSITVTLPSKRTAPAAYIVRTTSPDRFLVLVRASDTSTVLSTFRERTPFEANVLGVVKLAEEEILTPPP